MAKNNSVKGNFNYNNIEKKGKNFMYKNLERSNCYNCDFTRSNFDFVTFRGAHFKSCVFLNVPLNGLNSLEQILRVVISKILYLKMLYLTL